MALTIDHVPYTCSDLDATAAELSRLGLDPEYGGVHDNGVTHMSLLGFDDGSYLELIAETREGEHGFWPAHIRADAGPAAWCVRVPDIVAACRRGLESGWEVHGPLPGSREREDGTLVEWDRAEFGSHDDRLLVPFAIEDRTPRSYRVRPTPSVAGGPLTGVDAVVLASERPERAVGLLREGYRLPTPVRGPVDGLGRVASFPGQPLAVTEPDGQEWLEDRLSAFRDGPCACLLGTPDLAAAREAFPLTEPVSWPDGRVAFFESDRLGYRLGVVERK